MTKEEFKILFDTYFDSIRNYIYYRSGNSDLATDLAQDTFMKIWEKQLNIDHSKVKSLLYKMAGDLFISSYRKQKTEYKYQQLFVFESETNTPEESLIFKELNKKYQAILLKMPEKKRVVFLLNRMDNLTYAEIAVQLNISVKAVEKRMSEALMLLKDALIAVVISLMVYLLL